MTDQSKGPEDIYDAVRQFRKDHPESESSNTAPEELTIRELMWSAWRFANNACRMYPDNKHTFSDYWDSTGKDSAKGFIDQTFSLQKRIEELEGELQKKDAIIKGQAIINTNYVLRISSLEAVVKEKEEIIKAVNVKTEQMIIILERMGIK